MKTPQLPFPALAVALGIPQLYLKREDLHHFGSHKGRSIPRMIETYNKKFGISNFVVSSSGNTALAALLYIQNHNKNNPNEQLTLKIFVGNKIDSAKLEKLKTKLERSPSISKDQERLIIIEQVNNPKQQAFQLDKSGVVKFLRQSTDDLALTGYHELAQELDRIPNLSAIFIPTSSGATAQGLSEAFTHLNNKPQLHVVQSQACHPIIDKLTNSSETFSIKPSIATAIVDKIAHRKGAVTLVVKNSHGWGWQVSDEAIRDAIKLVKDTANIDISPNSALSIAGLKKAIQNNYHWPGAVVCLITGQ